MGKWDLSLKTLVWENPQDFVSLLLAGARYVGRREGQFQKREIRSDGLLEAEYAGEKLLIHVEFQVKKDTEIGDHQQVTQKAEKEGLQKGLRKGLEQGIHQSIETVVQARFPALTALAKDRLEHIQDQATLQQVLVAMSTAQTEKKARRYLLGLRQEH